MTAAGSGYRESVAPPAPGAAMSWTRWGLGRPSPLAPTAEELRISARLLLHVAGQPRLDPLETAPSALTQAGMAEALATSQPAVSNALRRLVDGGALCVGRRHVRRQRQRLKVYQLTPLGEELVRHIREGFGGPP